MAGSHPPTPTKGSLGRVPFYKIYIDCCSTPDCQHFGAMHLLTSVDVQFQPGRSYNFFLFSLELSSRGWQMYAVMIIHERRGQLMSNIFGLIWMEGPFHQHQRVTSGPSDCLLGCCENFLSCGEFFHITCCHVEKFSTWQIVMWKKLSTWENL